MSEGLQKQTRQQKLLKDDKYPKSQSSAKKHSTKMVDQREQKRMMREEKNALRQELAAFRRQRAEQNLAQGCSRVSEEKKSIPQSKNDTTEHKTTSQSNACKPRSVLPPSPIRFLRKLHSSMLSLLLVSLLLLLLLLLVLLLLLLYFIIIFLLLLLSLLLLL
jgi:hypothetical protein